MTVDNAAIRSDMAPADNAGAARCNNQPMGGVDKSRTIYLSGGARARMRRALMQG